MDFLIARAARGPKEKLCDRMSRQSSCASSFVRSDVPDHPALWAVLKGRHIGLALDNMEHPTQCVLRTDAALTYSSRQISPAFLREAVTRFLKVGPIWLIWQSTLWFDRRGCSTAHWPFHSDNLPLQVSAVMAMLAEQQIKDRSHWKLRLFSTHHHRVMSWYLNWVIFSHWVCPFRPTL